MKLPKFTATASLYKRSSNYESILSRKLEVNETNVIPQMRIRNPDCIPGCICFSPTNCPCCESIAG
jgi:hypothetical protein